MISVASTLAFLYGIEIVRSLYNFITNLRKVKTKLFRLAQYIPMVADEVRKERNKLKNECESKYRNARKDDVRLVLPDEGLPKEQILEKVKAWAGESKKYYVGKGNITGAVYANDESHWSFVADIIKEAIVANPLHIDEF